jgi:hypothetical protein
MQLVCQRLPELMQELRYLIRIDTPTESRLKNGGRPTPEPLCNPPCGITRSAFQLQAFGSTAKQRQIPVRDLAIPFRPKLRENPAVTVQQDSAAAREVEYRRHSIPQLLRSQPQPVRPVPEKGERRFEAGIIDN